jgi:hypothetical protein
MPLKGAAVLAIIDVVRDPTILVDPIIRRQPIILSNNSKAEEFVIIGYKEFELLMDELDVLRKDREQKSAVLPEES